MQQTLRYPPGFIVACIVRGIPPTRPDRATKMRVAIATLRAAHDNISEELRSMRLTRVPHKYERHNSAVRVAFPEAQHWKSFLPKVHGHHSLRKQNSNRVRAGCRSFCKP